MPMNNDNRKPTKIILTLPRCGTHFFWTRFVSSGKYQLVYDADRIPALKVLGEHCREKLDFLYPAPRNPNYNFQYNSLCEMTRTMAATEHIGKLKEKYSSADDYDLFRRIMDAQDTQGKTLLSINRFCYTISYDWLFKEISYSIDHALQALGLLCDWMERYGAKFSIMLIVRDVPDWIDSLFMLWGPKRRSRIARRVDELGPVLDWCRKRHVGVYWMADAIDAVNGGNLEFEGSIEPFGDADFERMAEGIARCRGELSNWQAQPNKIRWGRLLNYARQHDPILRTSLVRSIGTVPLNLGKRIPLIGRRIRRDFDGEILNNAKIRLP